MWLGTDAASSQGVLTVWCILHIPLPSNTKIIIHSRAYGAWMETAHGTQGNFDWRSTDRQHRQYSDWLWAGRSGFDSRWGLGILFGTVSRPALGPTLPPIQWVPRALSLGVKRPGREGDHLPPSSVEVKECMELYLHSPIRLHGVVLKLSTATLPSPFYLYCVPGNYEVTPHLYTVQSLNGHLYSYKVKVNMSLCFLLNWAPDHEGILAEWRYSSTHSWPWL
jgi:hypothetical protein